MKGTTDLWFASYLKNKKYKLCKFDIVGRSRGKYYFEITNDEWRAEKVSFVNSELSTHKQIIEELKDLLY